MINLEKALFIFTNLCLLIFTGVTAYNYTGNPVYYVLFSLVFNFALVKGLFKPRYYFETFWYGFLWLGFWLKFSYRTVLRDYNFIEATGNFVKDGPSFDKVLFVSTCALISSILSIELVYYISKKESLQHKIQSFPILKLYEKNWLWFWFAFTFALLTVAVVNNYHGIYLRGMVSDPRVPGVIRNVIVWMILTGFACIAGTILYWEILLKRHTFSALLLALIESFMTNVSMLSRAFIINASTYIWSVVKQKGQLKKIGMIKFVILCLTFVSLFAVSVIGVGYLRYAKYPEKKERTAEKANNFVKSNSTSLFIDRWVGLEGLMSVTSYPNLGWDLWNKAWTEKMDSTKISLYDLEIAKSQYVELNFTTQHFITLPGMIAFLFYPGSIVFLMFGVVFLSIIFILIEILLSGTIGNSILTALFAQSAAYKLLHFGYAPIHSWKYFAAFAMMLVLIYLLQKMKFKQD